MELPQSLEVLQTGIRDLGAAEVEFAQSGQTLAVLQTGAGRPKAQLFEFGQTLDVFQTGVGDLGAAEAQFLELPQRLEAL